MNEWMMNVKNLYKSYGTKQVLSNLSFGVNENGIIGLIGKNGSGKTTLLKLLAGRLEKTQGIISIFGKDPMDHISTQSQLIYTYHNLEYDKPLSLKSILFNYNLMFPQFDMEFAQKLMNYFELSPKMKYKQLSKGMGSTFNFLCALACRCPLTMFDEPILGMDVTVRRDIYQILLRDFTEHPRIVIVSSHLLSELEGILSHLLLLDNGALTLDSSMDEIRQSAYRLDGENTALVNFSEGKKIIAHKTGALQSFSVIHEPLTEEITQKAHQQGLDISTVRVEDLCIYLTKQDKEDGLECLWEKMN